MSVNAIESRYLYGNQNSTLEAGLPFSVSFNQAFDGNIFLQGAQNIYDIQDASDTVDIDRAGNQVKVIAHRGYTETAPENTIPAFVAAAEKGYSTVECDIEWTKDGVPVILHDATINRTARKENGWRLFFPRKCSDMTYDKLLEYDFGSWYSNDFKGTKIPSFDELLSCASDNDLNLYVELKETTDFNDEKAQALVDAVKNAGLEDKITWISFNEDYLKTMAKAMPEARLGYLSKKEVDENTIETLKNLQTGKNEVFLDLKSSRISKTSSKILEDSGFNFEVWTVDSSDEIKELAEYDCKGITTNKITEDDIADYYNPKRLM